MYKYILLACFSGILSAFSQVLLKKGSLKENRSAILDYLNPYVIGGYGITFLCMVLMIVAYKGMPFKYGSIIESLVFLHVMILSKVFFGEKITPKKMIGNLFIVIGVIIFSLQR